jgi:TolB-like protein
MTDIFLSYSREDAADAERLAGALQAVGYSCWWDRELVSGSRYLVETEAQLQAAKAVVVIWSSTSITSHWVADEAAAGRDDHRLAALTFDASMPPLGFRQFQVTDFAGWGGGTDELPFRNLLKGLQRLVPAVAGDDGSTPLRPVPNPLQNVSAPPSDLSLIVKPFEAIGGGVDIQDVADGLTEEVIGDLAKIRSLRVISRSAVARFKGSAASARDIAAEAKVRYVVTGTVRKGGSRLRVSCEVAEAAPDRVEWSDKFDGSADDPFSLQEAVARGIAGALHVRLTAADEARLATRPIADPRAAECARRALAALSQMSAAGLEQARAFIQQGIGIVGRNASLLGLEAAASFQYVNLGIDTEPAQVASRLARVEAVVAETLALDPNQPDALFTRAWQKGAEGRIAESLRDCVLALDVDPNHLGLRSLYGFVCSWSGLKDEFVRNMTHLEAIDPWNAWGSYQRALLSTTDGTPAERDAAIERMLALVGGGFGACIAAILWGFGGEWERARPVLESAVSLGGGDLGATLALAYLRALDGDTAGVQACLAPLRSTPSIERDLDWQHMMSVPYALVGDRDAALACLTRAVHLGFAEPVLLSSANRILAPLLDSPSGTALLQYAAAHRKAMRHALEGARREVSLRH